MTDNVTVVRYNDKLKATDNKLLELMDRYQRISINDSNLWATMVAAACSSFEEHARTGASNHAGGANQTSRAARITSPIFRTVTTKTL